MNRIILNETSYHGAGAVKEIVNELAHRGLKKPIVFSDPDLIKFGVTKKVTDLLDKAKVTAPRSCSDSKRVPRRATWGGASC